MGTRTGQSALSTEAISENAMSLTMKDCRFSVVISICAGILFAPQASFAKNKPHQDCKVYFTIVERDEQTSNLNMIGLNRPQQEWYEKSGVKEMPELCLVNGDATGMRITVESIDEKYAESIVGTRPFYSIMWEEHQIYVPDSAGGHYAYVATGILAIWTPSANKGDGDFVTLSPVHSTNRTIFSSSSVSLLKDALNYIAKRSGL